jgi:hypothetical protein
MESIFPSVRLGFSRLGFSRLGFSGIGFSTHLAEPANDHGLMVIILDTTGSYSWLHIHRNSKGSSEANAPVHPPVYVLVGPNEHNDDTRRNSQPPREYFRAEHATSG